MQRKIIKQNQTSFVITLPKKWIIKNNLSERNILEVIEENNKLILNCNNNKKDIEIDFNKINFNKERSAEIIINTLYRKGFNEINIKLLNEDKHIFEDLLESKNINDFEIFDEKKDFLKIINFIEDNEYNFDRLFEKVILIISEVIKNIENNTNQNKYIKRVERYIKLMRRILNNNLNKNINISDDILFNLVIINRNLSKLNKLEFNSNLQNQILSFFSKTFLDLRFEKIQIDEIQKLYRKIEKNILNKKLSQSDLYIWELIRNISYASINLNSNNLFIRIPNILKF